MASGDTLVSFNALNAIIPASESDSPQFDTRNYWPVLDFDADVDEQAAFVATVPQHYTGNGFTVIIGWAASAATSGNVLWGVKVVRVVPNVENLDTADNPVIVSAVSPAPSVSGQVQTTTVVMVPADIQNIAPGDLFQLSILRGALDPSDTMSGDAELVFVEVRET